MTERMIEANGAQLCADTIGDPGDPPVLLVMGMSASLIWWEDEFCARLAGKRRFVIRYDHRDTGRSVTYAPGRPGYTASDLVTDAAGVLDAYDLAGAHSSSTGTRYGVRGVPMTRITSARSHGMTSPARGTLPPPRTTRGCQMKIVGVLRCRRSARRPS